MEPAHVLQTFAGIRSISIKCMNEWVGCWWTYNPDGQDQIWNIIQSILTIPQQAMWQTVDREWHQCFLLTIFMRYICSSTCYLKLEMKVWSNLESGWMYWTILLLTTCLFGNWQCRAFTHERRLCLTALYLLVWGEAANLRFMPECLCYIFHNVRTIFLIVFPFFPEFFCLFGTTACGGHIPCWLDKLW